MACGCMTAWRELATTASGATDLARVLVTGWEPGAIVFAPHLPNTESGLICARVPGFNAIPLVTLEEPGAEAAGLPDSALHEWPVDPYSIGGVRLQLEHMMSTVVHTEREASDRVIRHEGLVVDRLGLRVWVYSLEVHLPPHEFDLLRLLIDQPGHVLAKRELLRTVWGERYLEESLLRTAVCDLRRRLGHASTYITTVPGTGYRFL